MAEHEIRVPNMGDDGPDEATVSFFCFEEGDAVKKDDKVLELLTDKATFDVISPVDGKVLRVLVEEDATVKPDQVLAVLEVD
jgi:2-oxoisovalerate dehydrogenase E2 component (dihydrolipoyl transacylase)